MPRAKARTKHCRRIAPLAGAAVRITSEEREAHAALPSMVIQGPPSWKRSLIRPAQPRTSKEKAARAWRQAVEEFDHLPLVLKAGDVEDPEGDYGGVGALFNFDHHLEQPDHVHKSGVFFTGLPSCKKKGQGTEHVPKTCKPYIPLLKNLIDSMADRAFPSFWPRLSANADNPNPNHTLTLTKFLAQVICKRGTRHQVACR